MKARKKLSVLLAVVFILSMVLSACGGGDTDTGTDTGGGEAAGDGVAKAYKGGNVYTVAGDDWDQSPAQAFAVDADGKLVAVGTDDEIDELIDDKTEVVDLTSKTVLPGFLDTHLHAPGLAITREYEIDMYEVFTKDDTLQVIQSFVDENPDLDVYYGSGFDMGIGGGASGPKKEWLDDICADKPIILNSSDGHTTWLNSKAFEEMNISADTKVTTGSLPIDPESGEVWGTVTDQFDLITMEPTYDADQRRTGLIDFQEDLLGWGFTGAMLIAPLFSSLEPDDIKGFAESGDMKLHYNLATEGTPEESVDEVVNNATETSALFEGTDVKLSTVKFFADGVVEGLTGYLQEPYEADALAEADKPKDYRSEPIHDPEQLREKFDAVMAAGFQIHVHSIGDAATRDTVDGMEYAQANNPDAHTRNVITHLQVVDPAEKKRMAELDIIGSTQPFWHFKEPEWFEYIDGPYLGEDRSWLEYPVKSLMDEGVMMTFSSDHFVTPVDNPFYAIEVSVTRNLFSGEYYGVDDITDIDDPTWLLNPDERITVKEAIEAYTINGAYQLFREDEIGSLEAGKYADFIVIGDDILKANPLDIDATELVATVIAGETVFGTL